MDNFISDLTRPEMLLMLTFAYALGSIPVGLILRRQSMISTSGLFFAVLTLLFDVAKGFVPVAVASSLEFSDEAQAFVGLAAFLGHSFPLWLLFRGGKGVASAFGVFLALSPWLGVIGFLVFGLLAFITKQVGVASVVASVTMLALSFFMIGNGNLELILAIIVFIIMVRHRSNIKRFLGKEA